jgi:hypothetical protein
MAKFYVPYLQVSCMKLFLVFLFPFISQHAIFRAACAVGRWSEWDMEWYDWSRYQTWSRCRSCGFQHVIFPNSSSGFSDTSDDRIVSIRHRGLLSWIVGLDILVHCLISGNVEILIYTTIYPSSLISLLILCSISILNLGMSSLGKFQ